MKKDPHYTIKLVLVSIFLVVTAFALYFSINSYYIHRVVIVPSNDEILENLRQVRIKRELLNATVAPSPSGLTRSEILAKQAIMRATK